MSVLGSRFDSSRAVDTVDWEADAVGVAATPAGATTEPDTLGGVVSDVVRTTSGATAVSGAVGEGVESVVGGVAFARLAPKTKTVR